MKTQAISTDTGTQHVPCPFSGEILCVTELNQGDRKLYSISHKASGMRIRPLFESCWIAARCVKRLERVFQADFWIQSSGLEGARKTAEIARAIDDLLAIEEQEHPESCPC